MDIGWKRLPLSNVPSRTLLYKIEFALESYIFHVTNMEQLWIESLGRRDIVMRAYTEDASMDPSETHEQMRIFFQHLSSALEGMPETSISVADAANNSVHVFTTTKLPGNLPPLKWRFAPCTSSQASFADEFVVPILRSIVHLKDQNSSLIGQLKDKDRVISKLLNKLESSGIDMTTAFPNLSLQGSRFNTEEAMLNAVKGLREFDESSWRRLIGPREDLEPGVEDVLKAALPFDTPHINLPRFDDRHVLAQDSSNASKPAQTSPRKQIKTEQSVANDGFFQRQATPKKIEHDPAPSRLASDNHGGRSDVLKPQATEDETASEDSDNLEASTKTVKPPSRVGDSSRTQSGSDRDSATAPRSNGKRKLGIVGGKKPAASSSEEDSAPRTKASVIKRSGFGKIGGKPVTTVAIDQETRELGKSISSLASRSTEQSSRESTPGKPVAVANGLLPEPSKTRAPSSEVQETPEERARRKRQEAKEIESRKAPVQKKRKF